MGVSLIIVDCAKQDINKALKEFKRKVIKSGHIIELKNRKEYKTPSATKREQTEKAVRKNQREVILDKIAAGTLPQSILSVKKRKSFRE